MDRSARRTDRRPCSRSPGRTPRDGAACSARAAACGGACHRARAASPARGRGEARGAGAPPRRRAPRHRGRGAGEAPRRRSSVDARREEEDRAAELADVAVDDSDDDGDVRGRRGARRRRRCWTWATATTRRRRRSTRGRETRDGRNAGARRAGPGLVARQVARRRARAARCPSISRDIGIGKKDAVAVIHPEDFERFVHRGGDAEGGTPAKSRGCTRAACRAVRAAAPPPRMRRTRTSCCAWWRAAGGAGTGRGTFGQGSARGSRRVRRRAGGFRRDFA